MPLRTSVPALSATISRPPSRADGSRSPASRAYGVTPASLIAPALTSYDAPASRVHVHVRAANGATRTLVRRRGPTAH